MLSPYLKLKNLLYIFQQYEYDILAFWSWIQQNKIFIDLEKKQKLVWTIKAKLIFSLSFFLFLLLLAFSAFSFYTGKIASGISLLFLAGVSFLFFPYLYLILASLLIKPLENLAKFFVIERAKRKLKNYPHLKIIGITGSYGKTSVKEFLDTILKTRFRVLKTPENINTPLGIAALIQKENLDAYDIFLVEMGAYRQGDIKQICQIVNPQIGILTGINEAHLEKFGSLAKTIQTKFELIESFPKNGKAFLNGDDENIKQNYLRYPGAELNLYSASACQNVSLSEKGTQFQLKLNGKNLDFIVKFLGRHNLTNLLGAILVAQTLGLTNAEIQKGVAQIQPVKHRLEPIFNPNGILVIDDSYNGNPTGVNAALDVLAELKNQRKIFITPGLVELGEKKAQVHRVIGQRLAQACDLVILIQNSNTPYFLQGLQQGGWKVSAEDPEQSLKQEPRLKIFDTSQSAHQALPQILQKGDVILFQNDWTDQYI